MAEINDPIKDIKTLLEYAKSLGMKEVSIPKDAKKAAKSSKNTAPKTAKTQILEAPVEGLADAMELADIRKVMGNCTRCKLCFGRKNIVFGVGNPNADLVFIGEAPGRDEDIKGEPFVGRAGQLLTKIIEAMNFKREDVYIANITKCRPPENRNPEPDEVASCIPFLIRQAELIKPKVIVCLGSVATQNLLGTEEKITTMRGKFTSWQGIPVMPTYHPAFLLRNPNMKRPVWEDMQVVMKKLEEL
ncbi:MAG: Uracil DNA glycosylase superfamily protein [bacterium ADurb.Bin270]|nr:MAG: Uracil DNA glycosylase superfamily protein [bacterium ADurb.Bin270]HQG13731.1 uracil-DNA glycosylase [bacterium]